MSNLHIRIEGLPKEEYNKIPVLYCKNCLSLKVMGVPGIDDASFCDDCGSSDIEQCTIEEWQKIYRDRYGFDYLDNTL